VHRATADAAAEETAMEQPLYERLGRSEGITKIVTDLIELHRVNPLIRTRFEKVDIGKLQKHVADFFCAGSGGGQSYGGRDMRTTHHGMNISEQEFLAAVDDVLEAMARNKAGQKECDEVLAILQ
jgi:hemoglobin